MGWKKSGIFKEPEELSIWTCDKCGKEMTNLSENGSEKVLYPNFQLEIEHSEHKYTDDCTSSFKDFCSAKCVKKYLDKHYKEA